MRITSFIIFNQLTRSLQKNMRVLYDYSNRLSTGKKINKPSDDAAGIARAMDYKARINENDQYMRNMDNALSYLEYADTAMSSVTTSLTRARELAIQAASGSQSAQTRANIAEEVAGIRDEIFKLSNSKLRSRYIFSGFKTDTASFDSAYNYQGDSGEINVMIDRNSTVAVNIAGSTAFSYGGTAFAELLDDFYVALQNNDETAIQNAITSIENMLDQASNVRTDIGARLSFLDNQKISLENRNYAFKTFLSNTEDADIAETISELKKTEVALQSLRVSGSEMMSQSLMDFLR